MTSSHWSENVIMTLTGQDLYVRDCALKEMKDYRQNPENKASADVALKSMCCHLDYLRPESIIFASAVTKWTIIRRRRSLTVF